MSERKVAKPERRRRGRSIRKARRERAQLAPFLAALDIELMPWQIDIMLRLHLPVVRRA